MKRTDADYHVGNLFQSGNPLTGQRGTRLEHTWLNNVQEELVTLILAAGIALDGDDQSQVLQALKRLSIGFDSLADAKMAVTDPDSPLAAGSLVLTRGYAAPGDGGDAAYVVVEGADIGGPNTHPEADQLKYVGDEWAPKMAGDGDTGLAAALAGGPVHLHADTLIATAGITVDEPGPMLAGYGWRWNAARTDYSGSVIEAADTTVANLLKLQSANPDSGPATDIHSAAVRDLALIHRGGGAGLTIDNIVRPRIDNVMIDCSDGDGAVGMHLDNYAFFSTMRGSVVRQFSDTGILVEGDGSGRTFEDLHVVSNIETAAYGFDIRTSGTTIKGGQINMDTGGTYQDAGAPEFVGGWAIRFYNDDADVQAGRSTVEDVLAESGNFVLIDAVAGGRFDNVEIVRARINHSNSNVSPAVYFGNTRNSILRDPKVKSTQADSVLAHFAAGAIDCGVICDNETAKLRMTADDAATRSYVRVTGRTPWADVLPYAPNIISYHYDWVEELGPVSRGTDGEWTGYLWSIADDAHVTKSNVGAGEYVIWSDQRATAWVKFILKPGTNHTIDRVATGTDAQTFLSDGTLDGTTGTDGQLTVQYSRTLEGLYIENRTGATRTFKMKRTSHV